MDKKTNLIKRITYEGLLISFPTTYKSAQQSHRRSQVEIFQWQSIQIIWVHQITCCLQVSLFQNCSILNMPESNCCQRKCTSLLAFLLDVSMWVKFICFLAYLLLLFCFFYSLIALALTCCLGRSLMALPVSYIITLGVASYHRNFTGVKSARVMF